MIIGTTIIEIMITETIIIIIIIIIIISPTMKESTPTIKIEDIVKIGGNKDLAQQPTVLTSTTTIEEIPL